MSGEDDLIASWFAPIAGTAGLGLRDDAACLSPPPGCDLIVTVDSLAAGVHFFADDPPGMIARKALRVNLSDLAAKGAEPLGFLLSLALPQNVDQSFVAAFADGLAEDARAHGCPLIGGDTIATPGPLLVSITAFGAVPAGAMVPRTRVAPGDRLYVSGTIGDAALGLVVRGRGERPAAGSHHDHLLSRYLLPCPRLALRQALRTFAHAAMDISDGLVGDLSKMLRVSGLGGRVDLPRVPFSAAARAWLAADPTAFPTLVSGGDDYEVLAAVAPADAVAFETAAAAAGVAVACVGHADADLDVTLFMDADGRPVSFTQPSFSHF